jgi:hypothetical protein
MKLLTKEEEQEHYKYVAAVSYSISSIAMDTMHINYIMPATPNFRFILSSTTVPPSRAAFSEALVAWLLLVVLWFSPTDDTTSLSNSHRN